MRRRVFSVLGTLALVACGADGSSSGEPAPDGAVVAPDAGADAPGASDASRADAIGPSDDAASAPCTTRVSYGAAWIHPSGHPLAYDDAAGRVTWDGTCVDDGPNSYAVLSNGWKPYFSGNAACLMALDASPGCAGVIPTCATRIRYGASWLRAANHPADYDDVGDRVLWDGVCHAAGSDSYAVLSNGWQPHFSGSECELSLAYTQCGGLYENPVVPVDCPDPGVVRDGARWIAACTSGGAADAFPIRVSSDLVAWSKSGYVFPSASKPGWATGDFWAPEIHRVGGAWVAYFTARAQDGKLSIGAATASDPLGPFADIGHPLLHDPSMGLIDASEYEAPDGKRYLLWKEDGNAVGKPTPIHGQELAPDGLSLVGGAATLVTNDQAWEGAVVEGPWMIDHGGSYFLFYSGNSYANATYAVGVARAASPLGPFTKAGGPIVVTKGEWVGPGHCSVVETPGGDTYMAYHAWRVGHVNGPGDGRLMLVDRVQWSNGWPELPVAPSYVSLPKP